MNDTPDTPGPPGTPDTDGGAGSRDLWDDPADHHDDEVHVDPTTGEIRVGAAAAASQDASGQNVSDLEDDSPGLYFGSVDEFVRELVVPTFTRRTGERQSTSRWASDWWRYPEAVMRLEAMWRSWEYLRQDPNTGLSVWLRVHADPHLEVLFSHDGPFAKSKDSSEHGDPLPYAPPPPGLFPDVRD